MIISSIIQKTKAVARKVLDKQSRILIKNSSWVFLENLIRTIFMFTRSIIIARGLGVELYGVFAIVVAFVSTVQEFFNLNIGTTIIKFGAEFRTEKRIDKLTALVKGSLFVTLISSLLSILLMSVLLIFSYETFIKKPGLGLYVIFYAIAFSTAFFDYISSSLLRLYYKFKLNSIIRIIMGTIEFIVVSATVLIYPGNLTLFFTAVIIAKLINTLANNGIAFWELREELKPYLKVKLNVIKPKLKEIMNFTIGNSLIRTLKTLMDKGDTLLLGALAGPIQVGYYTVAKKLAFSILRITDPLANSIFPQLSILISTKKYREIRVMLLKITKHAFSAGFIFLFFGYILKNDLITLMYGIQYFPATNSFFIHLTNAVFGGVFFWNLSIIQSLGLIKIRFYAYFGGLVLGLGTALFLIPTFGSSGAAIGLLVSNFVITIVFTHNSLMAIKKNINI